MFKTAIASLAAAAAVAAPSAALAGPYVNVESNASWAGDDYTGATTDLHIGYEGELGAGSFYVQGGPAIVAADGVEADTRFSGKVGAGIPVSEAVGVYGELAFITADDEGLFGDNLALGGKLGVKYNF
jgi:hypothetical protein|tara:strand:+ start:400 stop:783 length:384 start_codon:yes stop_codon:yes gene_type:complete